MNTPNNSWFRRTLKTLKKPPSDPIHTRTVLWGYGVLALFLPFLFYFYWPYYEDDVFISLRYSQHLLRGDGLVWNPGEYVEGYTNFLFVILTAGLGWLGMDLVDASFLISMVSYGLMGLCLGCWLPRILPLSTDTDLAQRAHRLVMPGAVLFSLCPLPMVTWAQGGMEPVLFGMLLTAGALLCLDQLQNHAISLPKLALTGLMFALATLTRPEGAMFFGLSGLVLTLHFFRQHRLRDFVPPLALCALVYSLIIGPYLLWKLSYYGDLLPNTWYAKNYGIDRKTLLSAGFTYLSHFLILPPWPLAFIAGGFIAYIGKRYLALPLAYPLLLIITALLYTLWIGGDYMITFRFFVPLIPLCSITLYLVMASLAARGHWISLRQFAFVLMLALFFSNLLYLMAARNVFSKTVLGSYVVANYIDTHWPKDRLIAVPVAGTLPYLLPEHIFLDTIGVADRHISRRIIGAFRGTDQSIPGHMKGDGAYVLSRKPHYIIFWDPFGVDYAGKTPAYLSEVELLESPEFLRDYRLRKVTLNIDTEAARYSSFHTRRLMQIGRDLNGGPEREFIYYERIVPETPASTTNVPVQ